MRAGNLIGPVLLCGLLVVGVFAVQSRDPVARAAPSAAAGKPLPAAPSPTPSPTPTKVPARKPVAVPKGMTAGYVVFDRKVGKVTVHRNVHKAYRSASVVKLLIAIDHLENDRKPDLASLKPMLRLSDDDAATALWNKGGQKKILQRMVKRIGLTDTGPPPVAKPGFWGYTSISALDIARVYRYILEKADPKVRDLIMGHLRNAQQCGADGFDQYFGIPRAIPRPWAVKQGWSGYGSVPPSKCVRARTASAGPDFAHPVLHTTGVIGNRYIVVILTTQTTSYADSMKKITRLARDVYRAAV